MSVRPNAHRHPPRAVRRGSAYLLVVMVTFIVVIIGLSAVAISRIEHRREIEANDAAIAREAALSGIEIASFTIRTATDWDRLLEGTGLWADRVRLGDATITVNRIGVDKSDPLSPRLTVRSIGSKGDARCVLEAVIVGAARIEEGSITRVPMP